MTGQEDDDRQEQDEGNGQLVWQSLHNKKKQAVHNDDLETNKKSPV